MLQLPARSDPDAGQYRTYHMAMRLRLWRGTSHSARNKKGAVDNWNTLQRLLEWNRNNEVKKVA